MEFFVAFKEAFDFGYYVIFIIALVITIVFMVANTIFTSICFCFHYLIYFHQVVTVQIVFYLFIIAIIIIIIIIVIIFITI